MEDPAVQRLCQALQFDTTSDTDLDTGQGYLVHPENMEKLNQFLIGAYPNVFQNSSPDVVEFELIDTYSFLITVHGIGGGHMEHGDVEGGSGRRRSSQHDPPFLLIAHMDVVPADPNMWNFGPFSGAIDNGFIYGRGVLDDKGAVMGILEALDSLLAEGRRPSRTFYVALTHAEEVMGSMGAFEVAKVLEEKLDGTQLEFIHDEGLVILTDAFPGQGPTALIGVTEKGYADIKISIETPTGHSSLPPESTAISKLSVAVLKVEKHRMPVHFIGTTIHANLVQILSDALPFFVPKLLITSFLYMFEPILKLLLRLSPAMNVQMSTTKLTTIFRGGLKPNMVPSSAYAIVNYRIHPFDTVNQMKTLTSQIVGKEFTCQAFDAFEPAKVSSSGSDSYRLIRNTIGSVFPHVHHILPGTLTGATDSKMFSHLAKDIYRFNPYQLSLKEDTPRIHGHNERIRVEHYAKVLEYFRSLIERAGHFK